MASETSLSPLLFQGIEPPARWKHISRDPEWTWKSNHPASRAFRTVVWGGGLGVPFLYVVPLEIFIRSAIINPGITFANRVVTWIHSEENEEHLFSSGSGSMIDPLEVLSISSSSNRADDESSLPEENPKEPYAFVPVHSDSDSITGSEPSQKAARKGPAVLIDEYGREEAARELIERALEGADQGPDGVAHLVQLNSSDSEHAARESAEILSDYDEQKEREPHYIPPELQTGWVYRFLGRKTS